MKKGITSLDALMAFMILLFMVIFIQKTTSSSLENSDSYGALMQAKANSQNLASIINTFYAANFSQEAKVTLPEKYSTASFFGELSGTVQIIKQENNLTTEVTTSKGTYSSSFPVVQNVNYNQGEVFS